MLKYKLSYQEKAQGWCLIQMKNYRIFMKNKIHRIIAGFLITTVLLFCSWWAAAEPTSEVPEAVYSGVDNAAVILKNIDYTDVRNSNSWAKEAIYETGALDIMKGYGSKQFGFKVPVTKEQAIGMAYVIVGKEVNAQTLGEALNNARPVASRKTDPLSVLADGFLQLAANDGLISAQDLADAFNTDPTTLTASSFYRNASAQRQEMAFWLAKVLNLQPAAGQKLYNNFNDWRSVDPAKVAYVESILQNNIMGGDTKGSFNPRQAVTREQAAQMIKNAENVALPLIKYERKTGTIESTMVSKDLSKGVDVTVTTFDVRNVNGRLHQINVETTDNSSSDPLNEQNGNILSRSEKELIVYKNGQIGKSSLLKAGDRIEYITAPDNTVHFVRVLSSVFDTKYIAAQVNSVDSSNLSINVSPLFNLGYPNLDVTKDNVSLDTGNEKTSETYRYSNKVSVTSEGQKSDMGKIQPGMNVILTVRNNVITAIKTVDLKKEMAGGVVKGIVEDNKPQLGYITLYNEDGTGDSTGGGGGSDGTNQLTAFRTYNYINPNDLEVFKNHKKAKIDDVEEGDTVFLKIGDNGNVESVSAIDNYTVKYGLVLARKSSSLAVRYDDGTQQVLDVTEGIPVFSGMKLAGYSVLKDGDRVKLLLHITSKFTRLKEITVQGNENYISNVYKGNISYIDDTSNMLVAQNLETFEKGEWMKSSVKGIMGIKLSDECDLYSGNTKLDTDSINKKYKNNDAYIAVQKDYGGREIAVAVSLRNEDDTEVLYDDMITDSVSGTDEFNLSKGDRVKYGSATIIIKDNRLVAGNSISKEDLAYVVSNRGYDTGEITAGVVQINQRQDINFVQVYRARIQKINENKDFTVESFSQLNGLNWEYSNTPKTFTLSPATTIIGDTGIVNQRDFLGYGDSSYIDRTVYILADNSKAVMVNTVPYGTYNAKGVLYDITGGTLGDEGTVTQEPTGIKMRNAKVYDVTTHMWTDSKDMTLNLLKNSIILKDNKIAKPSDLKKGEQVRVIKKDEKETGDAYIVIVEK